MGRKAYSPEKRLEMQNSVLNAARELFENEGREAVTMRRVGKQLGLSAMALYGYFEGKEKLVAALLDEGFLGLTRAIATDGSVDAFQVFADEQQGLLCWMIECGSEEQWRVVISSVRDAGGDSVQLGTLLGLGLLRVRGAVSGEEFASALQQFAKAA
jgi:AcrR family transcriptional regulator